MKQVLLIEPSVRKQHPNVGLLKIGGYHRSRGDRVVYVRDSGEHCPFKPDIVYASAIFTYYADKAVAMIRDVRRRFPRAELHVGGVYPSLLPEHVQQLTGVTPHIGLLDHVEMCPPSYDLIPSKDGFTDTSILFTTRGCWRTCKFCSVPTLEPKMTIVSNWQEHIRPDHRRVLIYDNNISAQDPRHRAAVFEHLARSGQEVLVDNGFDCTRFDDTHADEVAAVKNSRVRFALDYVGLIPQLEAAVMKCLRRGIAPSRIQVYVLCNFRDTVDDAIKRCEFVARLRVHPYPQIYRPYTQTSSRRPYVAPGWSISDMRMIRYFFTLPQLWKNWAFADWKEAGCPTLPGSKVNFYSEISQVRPSDFGVVDDSINQYGIPQSLLSISTVQGPGA